MKHRFFISVLIFLLAFACYANASKKLAMVIDVSIHQTMPLEKQRQIKHKLKQSFDQYISVPASRQDRVSLFQFTNIPDAPLTHRLCNQVLAKDKPSAHQAINNLEFTRTGCADWCMGLKFALDDSSNANVIYLITDENPCPTCDSKALQKIKKSHPGVQIFPVGIGPHVADIRLREASAPCLHCVKNKDYMHIVE